MKDVENIDPEEFRAWVKEMSSRVVPVLCEKCGKEYQTAWKDGGEPDHVISGLCWECLPWKTRNRRGRNI